MGVHISQPYKYGADADGNRYIWTQDIEFTSDISGKELDSDDLYQTEDGELCSYEELIKYLKIEKKEVQINEEIVCCECGEQLEEGSEYYIWDEENYDEECLDEIIWDQYKITSEEAVDNERQRQEDDYADYLADREEEAREARYLDMLDKYDL